MNIRTSQAVDAFDYRNSHKAYPEGPFEGAGVASESFERYYSFTFTNTAEYKFSLSDKHLFTVLAGQESIITKNRSSPTGYFWQTRKTRPVVLPNRHSNDQQNCS